MKYRQIWPLFLHPIPAEKARLRELLTIVVLVILRAALVPLSIAVVICDKL